MLIKKRLYYILVISLFSACAVKPPDVPVFEDLSQYTTIDVNTGHLILHPSPACIAAIHENFCGHGVFIISGKEIYVGENKANWFNGKAWSTLKAQSVYVPATESYAPISEYIINSCEKMNCNSQVDAFRIKLNTLQSVIP